MKEVEPYFYKRERGALSLDSSSECICEARVPEVGECDPADAFSFCVFCMKGLLQAWGDFTHKIGVWHAPEIRAESD